MTCGVRAISNNDKRAQAANDASLAVLRCPFVAFNAAIAER